MINNKGNTGHFMFSLVLKYIKQNLADKVYSF
jgi:hypothetical protein